MDGTGSKRDWLVAFELFEELGGKRLTTGQTACQVRKMAVKPADLRLDSAIKPHVCGGHALLTVTASKTADFRQPAHSFPDVRVRTGFAANHEQDRTRLRVGEDVLEVRLEAPNRIEGGEKVAEREESIAAVSVGSPVRFLGRVDEVVIPLGSLVVVVLLGLFPQAFFELSPFLVRANRSEVVKSPGHAEDGSCGTVAN